MKKQSIFTTIIRLLLVASLVIVPVQETKAYSYSGSAAVEFARSHCAANHTEYTANCPNNWICAEFVAECLRAGGLSITPSNLKVVRNLYNTLSKIGTASEIELSTQTTSGGDRYIKNTGSNVGKISVGDAIITYCAKHDIYLHATLVSQIDANGNVYAYSHNGNSFNRRATASRACKGINYAKEDYSDIKTYVIHFDSNSSASTPGETYAAAINTDGSLSINDSAKSTNNGAVSLGEIPEGAVCRTYPEKAVGNWMYVEYKGVQGYAYNNYLQSVSRTVSDGKKAEHPHMSYNQYSNGYVEELGYQDCYACSIVHPTCTEQGYEILQCMLCDYREISNYTDPTGHIWDNGTISVAPTTETEGVRTFICTECGTTKTEAIPKLDTSVTTPVPTVPPTSTNTPDTTPVKTPDIVPTTSPSPTNIPPTNTLNQDTTKVTDNTPTPINEPVNDTTQNPSSAGSAMEDNGHVEKGNIYKILSGKRVKLVKHYSKTSAVVIPNYVKIQGVKYKVVSIGARAFKNDKSLRKLTIGKYVKSIGREAFSGCKNLKKITLKTKSLTKKNVGAKAFAGVNRKVVIKAGVKQKNRFKKILM